MRADQAILAMSALSSVAVILQSIEVLILKKYWSFGGPWEWSQPQKDSRGPLAYVQSDRVFSQLLLLQIAMATLNAIAPNALFFALMFFVTLMVSVRFGGMINGAADSMTLYVLGGLFIATLLPGFQWFELIGLCFVGFMSLWSYFRSGISKVKRRAWWSGEALSLVLQASYARKELAAFGNRSGGLKFLSIAIILFELLSPLSLLHPGILFVFIAMAMSFHLANALALRLHRFFWIWTATFPALAYMSTQIARW